MKRKHEPRDAGGAQTGAEAEDSSLKTTEVISKAAQVNEDAFYNFSSYAALDAIQAAENSLLRHIQMSEQQPHQQQQQQQQEQPRAPVLHDPAPVTTATIAAAPTSSYYPVPQVVAPVVVPAMPPQLVLPAKTQPDIPAVQEGKRQRRFVMSSGTEKWEDTTLADWPENDWRIFVGDLGNDVTDDGLKAAFRRYPSCQRAKVIRDKKTQKTRGYGFVSFTDPQDFIKALREMQGKYIGSRPCKLRKSKWDEHLLNKTKGKNKQKKTGSNSLKKNKKHYF
eukprot:CAMPEP_0177656808 /NCGR_PEP_ID=MMETSP0447-20121125/15798_1 /TAXON_ID=0 /ORGANISM="Stygamoeba regulata, Strain BSH-02190019" /LENGTH=278 /DNA_ID=CAMNT_0019161019 /DNA_START=28 /DNA_END=864 /DNA_ORIENTATION=-